MLFSLDLNFRHLVSAAKDEETLAIFGLEKTCDNEAMAAGASNKLLISAVRHNATVACLRATQNDRTVFFLGLHDKYEVSDFCTVSRTVRVSG